MESEKLKKLLDEVSCCAARVPDNLPPENYAYRLGRVSGLFAAANILSQPDTQD